MKKPPQGGFLYWTLMQESNPPNLAKYFYDKNLPQMLSTHRKIFE